MGLLRIVILLLLLYILYRLVAGTGKRPARRSPAAGVTDVLEEDPVCHVCVPRAQAVSMREGERTVYFCSRECLARYREERRKTGR